MRVKKIMKQFYQEEINSVHQKKPQFTITTEKEPLKYGPLKQLLVTVCWCMIIFGIGAAGLSSLKSKKYDYLTVDFLAHQTSQVRTNVQINYWYLADYFENKNDSGKSSINEKTQ